jgi:glutathione-specific gamma-glutamylcyclotransferase
MLTETRAIFAYGSLIWRPGFTYLQKEKAIVQGYHRSLCIYSHVHRGTPERPGLVMGLDVGGECEGVVYYVAQEDFAATHAYLQAREMINGVYEEKWLEVQCASGQRCHALVYCVVQNHPQYTGQLSLDKKLSLIKDSKGQSGHNPDYVQNTHQALCELGIKDEELAALCARL